MSEVALDRIRDNLDQSWKDGDVTESELKDIHQTLQGLSPSERNEVVSKLSDEELAHWADEASSWVNGLSAGDRRDLLNQLAGSLDGQQLARVARNGGPWDYKQAGAQYEDFGNFNYGMTAAAMGIPEQVALRAAGWAQQQAGTSKDEWGNPIDIGGSYGDDPRDQAQIRWAYEYYRSGLWRVWAD